MATPPPRAYPHRVPGLSAAESAASLAQFFIQCVKKEQPSGELIEGADALWQKILPAGASRDEQADAMAHLVIEGQHLRNLRRRTTKRGSLHPATKSMAVLPVFSSAAVAQDPDAVVEMPPPPKERLVDFAVAPEGAQEEGAGKGVEA